MSQGIKEKIRNKQVVPKILVVDDNEKILESFHYALSTSGYESITVSNLIEAHEILSSQYVEAIVLDLDLNGESGLSFLKKIRKANNKIPVIIFSGSVSHETEVELRKAQANEIVDKAEGIIPVIKKLGVLLSNRS